MIGLLLEHPGWLAAAGLWFALVAASLWGAAVRGRRNLRALLGGDALRTRALRRQHVRRVARDVALIAALLFLTIGLLGPRIGRERVERSSSGIDVVVLLDTSRSMDARDIPPSRLLAARHAAILLLDGLAAGDRAALAIHAGRGVLLTPLTSDHAALREMVAAIESGLVRPGGSNLPAGIAVSLEAFEPAGDRPRAIFTLTDGEMAGHPIDDAVTQAVRMNTRVFAAAFGTRGGATIPDHGVPLRDASGRVVHTARRLGSLERLTRRTGGALFLADDWGQLDAAAAIRALRVPVAAGPGEFVAVQTTVPSVVPFAAVAALLLCLEWMLRHPRSASRGRARRASRAPRAAIVALALSLLGAAPADDPIRAPAFPDAETLLRAGLDEAAQRSWPQAQAHFRAAALSASSPELAAIAFHDLGVVALRQRRFADARDAFFDALAATTDASDPARVARTQWNLEWALIAAAPREEDPHADPPDLPGRKRPSDDDLPKDEEKKNEQKRERPEPVPEGKSATAPPRSHAPQSSAQAGTVRPAEVMPDLDAAARRAWLARVSDDPRRALLSAAFESPEARRRRSLGAPTW